MLCRMVTAHRSRSGSVAARKVIPKDVRTEYQRLYGVSSEAKASVPARTPAHEAKIRAGEFLAEVETRIATIRAAQRGEGQPLSQRQAFALGGEWYVWYVARRTQAHPSAGARCGTCSSSNSRAMRRRRSTRSRGRASSGHATPRFAPGYVRS